ncbi:MAG: hypothetical protein Q7S92_06685 [Candidatus Diapherotrites archaeon]|nr:hypothetical protein [Candidatus Diapherotrites archaeon]
MNRFESFKFSPKNPKYISGLRARWLAYVVKHRTRKRIQRTGKRYPKRILQR